MNKIRHEVLALAGLVLLGVVLRLALRDIPNFAPVAGIALFAGYLFRSRWMALAAPLGVMLISDFFLGGYAFWMMAIVYGMLALPVMASGWLRNRVQLGNATWQSNLRSVATLVSSALAASVSFFLVTNFAVWWAWYERSWAGLAECYLLALPFFRFTFAGDLVFATLLFSSYAVALSIKTARASESSPEGRTALDG